MACKPWFADLGIEDTIVSYNFRTLSVPYLEIGSSRIFLSSLVNIKGLFTTGVVLLVLANTV